MNDNQKNFELWYKRPLESLHTNIHAGFAVMMVTLPLLERYVRNVTGTDGDLGEPFHTKVCDIFPSLQQWQTSQKFWKAYRHGILHRATIKVTLAAQSAYGPIEIGLGDFADAENKYIAWTGPNSFRVAPVHFSKKVLSVIESDFPNFESDASGEHPPALLSTPPSGASGFSGYKKK